MSEKNSILSLEIAKTKKLIDGFIIPLQRLEIEQNFINFEGIVLKMNACIRKYIN